ncbi:universal stress protein [Chitinibacter bivalviorum]|uniref:Universal stress protein n=1 Tax=Chitinibacter bivalviorum TaxID=2739434 RepID=A0A7H9BHJ2_9NEIS|nr:universal stress protein [Chitinibacter bivalviorum]QLG87421.1 universal stress protein [Chitinibacter bivalviorum]
MYSRILVPVDHSDTSAAALAEASKLATEQHAVVRLIHVIDLAQFAWSANEFLDVPQLQASLKEGGEKLLQERVALLESQGIKVESALVEIWGGQIARTIVDESSKWEAHLLVMGTHGYGGLTHMLLGSVAEGVMRHTHIPVLLVKADDRPAV